MKRILRPYFFISLCGLIAFAPVSFMLRALKNDIIALEYPINHFISQSIRHGEWPIWFNTWGMGFPLQSNLTWGVFSTPQLLFSSLFNYNIYTLHIEFMFFILLAGWSMFYLLKRFFLKDENVAVLLSLAYMLSGFMVGSTQWLLYITAAAFIPLLLISLLVLLEKPGWRSSLQLAVVYAVMFTSVYAAFNIITSYSVVIFIIITLLKEKDKLLFRKQLAYLLMAAAMILVLCLPVVLFTMEVLQNTGRAEGISDGAVFSNSNYLHPYGLQSMFLPFSAVKMQFPNTEGTMLASYAGMFVLLLAPAMLWRSIRERHRGSIVMMVVALLFLVISFGTMGGIRPLLNSLPGFSYFRNPSIFRFYFILSLILFLAVSIRKRGFNTLFAGKTIMYMAVSCCVIYAETLYSYSRQVHFNFGSTGRLVKDLTEQQAMVISALIQLAIVLLAWLLVYKKKWKLCFYLFAADLVFNTLLCTPFFSVSSYTPAEVNGILKIANGFPLQSTAPSEVNAVYTDNKGNTWQNVNIFSKEVSGQPSYRGPLVLKGPKIDAPGKQLVYAPLDPTASVQILVQKPGYIRVKAKAGKVTALTLQQNRFKGWKVYVDGKRASFFLCFTDDTGKYVLPAGRSTIIPKGESVVEFKYERNDVAGFAIFFHLVIIGFIAFQVIRFSRSSYPSLPR